MKSISSFVNKKSPVHSVDGVTKICYILTMITIPFIIPGLIVPIICLLCHLIILSVGKVIKNALPIFGFLVFMLATIIIIQSTIGVNNKTPLFSVGVVVVYKEGLLRSAEIIFQLLNIVAGFLILVFTTSPQDLVADLVVLGLPPSIGFVIISVFQIIPYMTSATQSIMDAQRSRGMETEGKLMVRIKAYIPLLAPVVLSSLIDTKERAMALEVRGFNSKAPKTYLNEPKRYKYRVPMRVLFATLLTAALVWRLTR